MKYEGLLLVHIELFHYFYYFFFHLYIYLFIYLLIYFCLQRRLETFLSLQKTTFGRSARQKFKLLIDKYKIESQKLQVSHSDLHAVYA